MPKQQTRRALTVDAGDAQTAAAPAPAAEPSPGVTTCVGGNPPGQSSGRPAAGGAPQTEPAGPGTASASALAEGGARPSDRRTGAAGLSRPPGPPGSCACAGRPPPPRQAPVSTRPGTPPHPPSALVDSASSVTAPPLDQTTRDLPKRPAEHANPARTSAQGFARVCFASSIRSRAFDSPVVVFPTLWGDARAACTRASHPCPLNVSVAGGRAHACPSGGVPSADAGVASTGRIRSKGTPPPMGLRVNTSLQTMRLGFVGFYFFSFPAHKRHGLSNAVIFFHHVFPSKPLR